jgi:hypothetical protein
MAINYFEDLGFGANLRQGLGDLAQVGYMKQAQAAQQAAEQKKEDQAMLKFANDQQKQRAAQSAGAFYNALQSGNPQLALQIAKQSEQDINSLGDPSFTVANVEQMLQTPEGMNQLKQMAAGTVQMAAGPEKFAEYVQAQQKPVAAEKPQPFQQGAGDAAGYVFNPNTGQYQAADNVLSRINIAKQAKEQGSTIDVKDIASINKDVTNLAKESEMIYRTSKDITKLKDLGGGPASISIVYKFMKSLDPTSVVREGEFATAENAGGVPDSVLNIYNKLVTGERLPDKVMEDFEIAAAELANSSIDATGQAVDNYLNTFDDKLPEKLKTSLRARVPSKIELKNKKVNDFLGRNPQPVQLVQPTQEQADIQLSINENPASTSIQEVGRFKVRVK